MTDLTAVQRPKRADAARNFDAVLAAAKDAFAEKGPDASASGPFSVRPRRPAHGRERAKVGSRGMPRAARTAVSPCGRTLGWIGEPRPDAVL